MVESVKISVSETEENIIRELSDAISDVLKKKPVWADKDTDIIIKSIQELNFKIFEIKTVAPSWFDREIESINNNTENIFKKYDQFSTDIKNDLIQQLEKLENRFNQYNENKSYLNNSLSMINSSLKKLSNVLINLKRETESQNNQVFEFVEKDLIKKIENATDLIIKSVKITVSETTANIVTNFSDAIINILEKKPAWVDEDIDLVKKSIEDFDIKISKIIAVKPDWFDDERAAINRNTENLFKNHTQYSTAIKNELIDKLETLFNQNTKNKSDLNDSFKELSNVLIVLKSDIEKDLIKKIENASDLVIKRYFKELKIVEMLKNIENKMNYNSLPWYKKLFKKNKVPNE